MAKRILYVEDTPQNMLLIRRIMGALGHELLEAVNGEEGWTMATNERPDLILMDLSLPGKVSGFELTRRIKAQPELSHIPIVVLTAYGYDEVEQKAILAGCDGFLVKPADIRQIRDTIERYLDGSEVHGPNALSPDVIVPPLSSSHYTFI